MGTVSIVRKLALVLVVAALPMRAQTLGEITGRIVDASGAAVPSASVTLVNSATNFERETLSNGTGDYTFPSLAPGIYNLKISHQGFKTSESQGVEVQVQQTAAWISPCRWANFRESVRWSAQPTQLQAENATVGTVIENKRIVELPLNGRNYLQLVALTPNVTTLRPQPGRPARARAATAPDQSISVAGQRTMFDYFTLDGVNNTDPNFNTYVVLPSIDALQEFKVQTGVYPAEFGHNATQINVLDQIRRQPVSRRAVRVFAQRRAGCEALFVHQPIRRSRTHSNGTSSALSWTARCGSRSCSTAKTSCSSWRTTKSFRQRQNLQSIYTVPRPHVERRLQRRSSNTIYDPTDARRRSRAT